MLLYTIPVTTDQQPGAMNKYVAMTAKIQKITETESGTVPVYSDFPL